MLKKKLTFLIIPDSSGTSKQVQLSLISITVFGLILISLIVAVFFFASEFFTDQVSESQLVQLQSENQHLHQKFEQMRWDLAQTETRYEELVEKEIAIRTMFDLPEINAEERQLGIGGPVTPVFARMSEAQKKTYETEVEVDRLLRLSRFELEKFDEIENELGSLKTRLDHTPSILPTKGWNSRGFGMKFDPFTGYKQFHRGVDIANKTGTPIIATGDGTIKSAGKVGGMGNMIVINHGYGFLSRYGHLSKIEVKNGQRVKRGDVIGYMGSTGYSTGPHLHYEVWRNGKPLNPSEFILNDR